MTQTPGPFSFLNDCDYIAIMPNAPSVAYGPFTVSEVADFIDANNAVLTRLNLPGRFVAVPLSRP